MITEPWRIPLLGIAAAAFAAAVVVVGGIRGARSRVALALTLTVVVNLIPEFIPVLGPLDDVVVAVLFLRYVKRRLGEEAFG